jgi:hypothetical protein
MFASLKKRHHSPEYAITVKCFAARLVLGAFYRHCFADIQIKIKKIPGGW